MVPGRGLWQDCGQDMGQGCSLLKARLEQLDLLIDMFVPFNSRRPQFLNVDLSTGLLEYIHNMVAASSRVSDSRENKEETTLPFKSQ